MAGPRIRQAIDGIPGYKPGRVPPGGAAFKLSSNENPYPPLPAVLEVLARRSFLQRLPWDAQRDLADRRGVQLPGQTRIERKRA